jgi:hypothetical protein
MAAATIDIAGEDSAWMLPFTINFPISPRKYKTPKKVEPAAVKSKILLSETLVVSDCVVSILALIFPPEHYLGY